jgi:hypothetical protein
MGWSKPAAGLEAIGNSHMASNIDAEPIKKENPLSNANLPGGIFTHPGVC